MQSGIANRGQTWLKGCMVATLVMLFGCASYETPPGGEVSGVEAEGPCGSEMARQAVRFANHARGEFGVAPLRCDATLVQLAEAHSRDMCEQDYISHIDSQGRTLEDRFDEVGYDFRAIGENVAMGQREARNAHDGWMNSSSHRDNIVSEDFEYIGVGYVECGGVPRWTQVFSGTW